MYLNFKIYMQTASGLKNTIAMFHWWEWSTHLEPGAYSTLSPLSLSQFINNGFILMLQILLLGFNLMLYPLETFETSSQELYKANSPNYSKWVPGCGQCHFLKFKH